MLCLVSQTKERLGPQIGACHHHQGSSSVYVSIFPRGPVWRRHIEQLKPRYRVEEDLDLDPGQASELMAPQENLGSGKMPKELGDSRVEEPDSRTDLEIGMHQLNTGGHDSRKPNPRLPMRCEYEPHNPRRSK